MKKRNEYKEGMKVCLSVKTLYENNADLSYGMIVPDYEEGTIKYYDLYNEDGELACCDGEEVIIEQVGEVLITFRCSDSVYLTLTKDEADIAIFM